MSIRPALITLPTDRRIFATIDNDAARENYSRSCAGGRIFKPTFVITEIDEAHRSAALWRAYDFTATHVSGLNVIGGLKKLFPYLPAAVRDAAALFELHGVVALCTSQPFDFPNQPPLKVKARKANTTTQET